MFPFNNLSFPLVHVNDLKFIIKQCFCLLLCTCAALEMKI